MKKTPNVYLTHATLSYDKKTIFSNLTLHLPSGQWIGLIGTSGVGKSSLLRLIAGLTTPGQELHATLYADNGIAVKEQIAYMAQTDLLVPWLTVLDNAALKVKLAPNEKSRHNIINRAKDLLKKVGLDYALHLYPHQLSGGMRQRVALVRTLIEDKPVVLMDEPFSALDAITRYKLQDLAATLLQGKTVLFITHDPSEALRLAHEVYIMQGMPAHLKSIAKLSSPIPRQLMQPDVIHLQSLLFNKLTAAEDTAL